MKFNQTAHDVHTLGTLGRNLDPRRIIGIAVTGRTLHLQTVDFPARITEKMSMQIPEMQFPAGAEATTLKSLQMKNRFMVIELTGALTEPVKHVVNAIAGRLTENNMVTAFFPGSAVSAPSAPTDYWFGFDTGTLRAVNPHVRNIRLLDNRQSLVFTQANQMKLLPLSSINQSWVKEASVVYDGKKEIAFLGRVQSGKIALTMSDGTTFMATLTHTRANVTSLTTFRPRVSKVLGTLYQAGTAIFAGVKGRELILVPAMNE